MLRCLQILCALLLLALAPISAEAQAPLLEIYKAALPGGKLRTYYIAAEEITWNYAPSGEDLAMGHHLHGDRALYVERSAGSLGAAVTKAVYVAYTDDTFATRLARPPEDAYLGLLGPILRAEVGDVIRVIFRNKAAREYSMHPHGVFYTKADEGAGYNDGTSLTEKRDDAVRPGDTQIYVWKVPERAGPGPRDPSSIAWPYHSHVDEPADTNSGLIGAIIITARGKAGANARPRGVDRELITLWKIFDEGKSWYAPGNARAANIDLDTLRRDPARLEKFQHGNQKHAINGFIFGNMPVPEIRIGQRVRWHVIGLGGVQDVHTVHWHGATVLAQGRRKDVVSILPAESATVDMLADNPGTWMLHCHVDEHMQAGMHARYRILPAKR
jgi:manganese oxidase